RRAWRDFTRPDAQDDSAERVAALEREAARARERMLRATEMLVDGGLAREQYDALIARQTITVEAAEAEIARLRAKGAPAPTLPELDAVLAQAGGWAAILRGTSPTAQRALLAELVD